MFQFAALPAQIAPPAPSAVVAAGANPAGMLDFASLLGASSPEAPAPVAAPGTPGAERAALQVSAVPAAPDGKILPPPLAGLAGLAGLAVPTGTEPGDGAPHPAAAPPVPALVAFRLPLPALAEPRAPRPEAKAAAPGADTDDATDDETAMAPEAAPVPIAAPLPASARTDLAAPPPLPPLVEAQLRGQPLVRADLPPAPASAEPPPSAARTEASEVRVVPLAALRPDLAPDAGAFSLAVGEAQAAKPGTVHLRLAEAAAPAPSGSDLASSGMAMASPLSADAPAPALAPAAPPGNAPHDFATLVDRLIEARDAARPQGVSLALDHADFGKVSLHFRHDEAGLSVSASSPDPAFARAVEAAIPAAAASTGADASPGQNGNAGAGSSTSAQLAQGNGQPQGQASAQGRSASPERTPANAPASRDEPGEPQPEAPAQRRGRFA